MELTELAVNGRRNSGLLHFFPRSAPTSASWLNMVERISRDLSESQLQRTTVKLFPNMTAPTGQIIAKHNIALETEYLDRKSDRRTGQICRARVPSLISFNLFDALH